MHKSIGNKIKKLRLEKKMTQENLGKMLDVSDAYISHLESGRRKISLELLEILSEIFEVEITYFLSDNLTEFDLDENEKAWYYYHKKLEDEGFTLEDIKEWVEIAKTMRKK